MSDGWPAYHNLDQLNDGVYLHGVVIHEQNFVNPLHPEIHIQNVENMWMRANSRDGSAQRNLLKWIEPPVCVGRNDKAEPSVRVGRTIRDPPPRPAAGLKFDGNGALLRSRHRKNVVKCHENL
ncbi:hypothetical protein LSAT2_024645 [Lamellibrachia satsuma]|nr:hypothetical protein LSAT2_024645 [Lamellibrachia satsuma]